MKCPKCTNEISKYSEVKQFYSVWLLPKKNACPKCKVIIEPTKLGTLLGVSALVIAVMNLFAMALLGKFFLYSTACAFLLMILGFAVQKFKVSCVQH